MKNQLTLFALTTAFLAACASSGQQAPKKPDGHSDSTRIEAGKTGEKGKKDSSNIYQQSTSPDPGSLAMPGPVDPY